MKPEVGQRWTDGFSHYDVLRADDKWLRVRTDRGGETSWLVALCIHDTYIGPTPSTIPGPTAALPSSMVAGPGAPDRSGCKSWCGLPTISELVPTCIPTRPGPQEGTDRFTDRHPPANDEMRSYCTASCLERRAPLAPTAAPPTREQILAEELAARAPTPPVPTECYGKPICNWGHDPSCPAYPRDRPRKTPEETAAELAIIQRIRVHALAEGGDSATRAAPGRTPPKPWVPSVDDFDLLPDAEPHSSRYRR